MTDNGGADDDDDEDAVATASDGEPSEPTIHQTATEPGSSTVHQRRELLDAKLKEFRHEKLKRKIPVDTQLLDCAREELQIKKRLVEQMDRVDKQHSDTMVKLSNNMEKLTDSIADGFSLLRNLLTPQTQPVYPYQPAMYGNTHSLGDLHQQRPSGPPY